ncbi:hypothetical protein E2C01_056847 [Portunus trituberculatus]|uniref:Uncharacterized protein n=1 Tax=Portunus trituberculatus TaxID=210409 RepID=A0A5B7H093_PORTR|nr:hypothetical protein [Portunus trituberculatus]
MHWETLMLCFMMPHRKRKTKKSGTAGEAPDFLLGIKKKKILNYFKGIFSRHYLHGTLPPRDQLYRRESQTQTLR